MADRQPFPDQPALPELLPLPPVEQHQLARGGLASAIPAVALIAVGTFGFAQFGVPYQQSKGDQVSRTDVAALQESFARAQGAPVPVDLSRQQQRSSVITSLAMPKDQAERVLQLADDGKLAIGWITVWDNYDEDGDAVSITAAGFTQTVPVAHLPTIVALPYLPGQPVTITGHQDGGGGVTVAVELSTGPIPLPPLAVGQSVTLPLL